MFKDHKISAGEILNSIPSDIFSQLDEVAKNTNVDRYAKRLRGETLFNLLLYGLLENDRLSQRTLEDTFNSEEFKFFFDVPANSTIRHSSISERLSKINVEYFRVIYERVYASLTKHYNPTDIAKHKLIRVDSSIVYEASQRLIDGFKYNQSNKRAAKLTVAHDGLLPCDVNVFTDSSYASENVALPEAVRAYAHRGDANCIALLDRGVSSSLKMQDFNSDGIQFIVRITNGRKHRVLEEYVVEEEDADSVVILKDLRVRLFAQKTTPTKTGGKRKNTIEVEDDFRLVMCQSKDNAEEQYWFVTNNFDITSKEVAQFYRRRWDIEVFFRFIKQEMNASRFVSLNKNGMEVMMYMTMIASMLLLIYKKINGIGYKTAKRRFTMEMRKIIISEIVRLCGGDPSLFYS